MSVDEAKARIFHRLCSEFKSRGADAWIEWEPLERDLGIPHGLFPQALEGITFGSGDIYAKLDKEHKRIRLASLGQQKCSEGINPFFPTCGRPGGTI